MVGPLDEFGNEVVTLTGSLDALPRNTKWKVTARYTVQLGPQNQVPCVRVRGYIGTSTIVLHFSEVEFARLFKPAAGTKKRKKA